MGGGAAPGGGAAGAESNDGSGPIMGTCAATGPVSANPNSPASAARQRKVMLFPFYSKVPAARGQFPSVKQPHDFGRKAANRLGGGPDRRIPPESARAVDFPSRRMVRPGESPRAGIGDAMHWSYPRKRHWDG